MNHTVKFILAAAVLALAGCDTQQTMKRIVDLKQVRGLEDCTYYVVEPGGINPTMYVIRCPNSTTSTAYQSGGNQMNTVIIDGVEYQRKASSK